MPTEKGYKVGEPGPSGRVRRAYSLVPAAVRVALIQKGYNSLAGYERAHGLPAGTGKKPENWEAMRVRLGLSKEEAPLPESPWNKDKGQSVWLSDGTHARLKAEAARQGVSLTSLAEQFISEALDTLRNMKRSSPLRS